ncbi:hypothetical protein LCGC14_1187600, partial [marine sediment metagenome]
TRTFSRRMAACPGDLSSERVVQPIDCVAHVIHHVAEMQALATPVARINDVLQILRDLDDRVLVGQRAMAQVVDRVDLGVGLYDPLGQFGKGLLESVVGGHLNKTPVKRSIEKRRTRTNPKIISL